MAGKFIVLVVLLLLPINGCGGELVKPSMHLETSLVTWVVVDEGTINEFCEAVIGKRAPGKTGFYRACASFNRISGICTIYAPMIVEVSDEATTVLGHEVGHCFLGTYHE